MLKHIEAGALDPFSVSARTMAAWSMTGPRPTLMITRVGFMAANSLSLIMWWVSAVRGRETTT